MSDYKLKLNAIEKLERLAWWRGILIAISFASFCALILGSLFIGASPKSYTSAFKWFVSTGSMGGFQAAAIIVGLLSGIAAAFVHLLLKKSKIENE